MKQTRPTTTPLDTPGVTLEPPELQPSVLGERVELPESNVDRVAAFSVSRALGLATGHHRFSVVHGDDCNQRSVTLQAHTSAGAPARIVVAADTSTTLRGGVTILREREPPFCRDKKSWRRQMCGAQKHGAHDDTAWKRA
jgi:hypothetical protein